MDDAVTTSKIAPWPLRICRVQGGDESGAIELLEAATQAIRSILGDGRYVYRTLDATDEHAIDNPVEKMVVPLAVLAFGSAHAYSTLIRHGLEREALIMQRQLIEYYVRIKYYSESPKAALFDWLLESIAEEKRFLDENGAHFGSVRRPRDLQKTMQDAWRFLGGRASVAVTTDKFVERLRKVRSDAGAPPERMIDLAKRYCLGPDYGLYYGIPSKVSHGSEFVRGFAEHNGRLQYSSFISNSNQKVVVVSEYLIELLAVLQTVAVPKERVDIKKFRTELKTLQRALKVHRPK